MLEELEFERFDAEEVLTALALQGYLTKTGFLSEGAREKLQAAAKTAALQEEQERRVERAHREADR